MESANPATSAEIVELTDPVTCKLIKSVTVGLFGATLHKCIATNG